MPTPRIFISAGEASGEHYGARLIEAIRARRPEAEFFGLGGAAMEAAGCRRVVRAEDIAAMGITEVLRHVPRIYGEYRRLKRSALSGRPDVAVLIDFPDINFRLARALKKRNVPVIYFVSPQIWAWKQRRIQWVRDWVTKMLVIFPFEEAYYRERGVEAEYIGHPLADLALPVTDRWKFANQYGLDPSKQWIGLLPGSRTGQLRRHIPLMVATAGHLGNAYEYVLPAAATLDPAWVRTVVAQSLDAQPGSNISVHVVKDPRRVLSQARASIVSSGTATVEAALIGNPFLAVYRLSALSYAIASRVVRTPHVAMANLIAGRCVVPELLQADFTPEKTAAALRPLLEDGEARETMIRDLEDVRLALQVKDTTGAGLSQLSADIHSSQATAIDRAAEWTLHYAEAGQRAAALR
jgi:lipid-A-disaccharide synthase